MSTTQELRKPVFIKVKELERARSGYNVIVKIVSAEVREIQTKSGLKIKMVDAIVGDQTAVAKAFFKGENAVHVEKGKVIAIRNGLKRFIKNFISLELDIFGRVTQQKADISVNESLNISEQEHKLPEGQRGERNFRGGRGDNRRGGNRRFNDGRPPRRFNNDREEGGNYRGDRADRGNRGYRADRQDRGDRGDRVERGDRGDRGQRFNQQRDTRPYRNNDREGGRRFDRGESAPYKRRQYDENRPPRRQYDRDFDRRRENNRPPRRQEGGYQPRREQPRREQFRERRPAIQWTKVDEISPGDDRLNLLVKVISEQLVQGKRAMLRCVFGDQSGTVRAFFPQSSVLRVGKSIALFGVEARVVKQHIELQEGRNGRVQAARKQLERVNEKFNISDKSWVPVDN